MFLKACINGARRPDAHPALPVTPTDAARAALASVESGAGAIHVHVRGANFNESLEADDVAETIRALRAVLPGIPIGVSTGAWIVKDPDRRHALVASWTVLPDFASVNFHEPGAARLADLLIAKGIGVEGGLFHVAAAEVCIASGLAARCLRLMFEPSERDLPGALKTVAEVEHLLDTAGVATPRLLHGSGATAWDLIDEAARRSYDTRAGLEDMLDMPDGTRALDNAAVVAEARRRLLHLQAR
jgi:uncharacterized protein (DUF849 family)